MFLVEISKKHIELNLSSSKNPKFLEVGGKYLGIFTASQPLFGSEIDGNVCVGGWQ